VSAAHDLADLAGLALVVGGGAQGVVEHDHARSPALGFHQRFHLRVVDSCNLLLIEEICHLRIVTDEPEAVALKLETRRLLPAVVDFQD